MNPPNESRLVYTIMQELGRHGAIFRTNSGQFYTKSGQRVSGLPRGFSDILFIRKDGTPCFIECKIKGNKPSEEQILFIEKMKSLNCIAGVCCSTDEAMRLCGIGEGNA